MSLASRALLARRVRRHVVYIHILNVHQTLSHSAVVGLSFRAPPLTYTAGDARFSFVAVTCPGFPDDECSGHGTCLSMSQLAQVATVNGEAATFTYGRTPHDAGRWDYDQVYGCFCEEGFHGYDCSQRTYKSPCGPGSRSSSCLSMSWPSSS